MPQYRIAIQGRRAIPRPLNKLVADTESGQHIERLVFWNTPLAFDDEWDDPFAPLTEMIEEELNTERFLEPEVVEETVLPGFDA
jgi:hypothetical protein